jgi:hypothetical protein
MKLDRPGDRDMKDYELVIAAVRRSDEQGLLSELDRQTGVRNRTRSVRQATARPLRRIRNSAQDFGLRLRRQDNPSRRGQIAFRRRREKTVQGRSLLVEIAVSGPCCDPVGCRTRREWMGERVRQGRARRRRCRDVVLRSWYPGLPRTRVDQLKSSRLDRDAGTRSAPRTRDCADGGPLGGQGIRCRRTR